MSVLCHSPCYKSIIIINKKNYKHDFETIKEKKEKNYIVLLELSCIAILITKGCQA